MNINKRLLQLRIPTLAAFLFLLGSLWVITLLIQTQTSFVSKAGPDKEPHNVKFTNITNSSFSIVFTTTTRAVSGISVEDGETSPYVIFDDRDKKTGARNAYYSHHITVSNLKPQAKYNIKILSEGTSYPTDGSYYSVALGPLLPKSNQSGNIKGKVLLPDDLSGSDTLVILEVEGGQSLSVLTDNDGNYTVPLSNLRTKDLKSYLKYSSKNATLHFFRSDLSSSIKLTTDSLSIPPITLSYTYDFTDISESEVSTGSSIIEIPSTNIPTGSVKVTNPKPGDSFVDDRPLFQGTALPNSEVRITIESDPVYATVKANSRGAWSFRPAVRLYPGAHTISVSSLDGAGILRTVSVNFSIFAQGSQIAQAGPTVTPTPPVATATPTRTPTPTPTKAPSVTTIPTPTVIPTSTVVQPSPTLIPTSTLIPTPTTILATSIPTKPPTITPPPTGTASTVILTTISFVLILAGVAIFFIL